MKDNDAGADEVTANRFSNGDGFIYPGRELEAMIEADNYHRWILSIFKPFLGQNIVEVGAGMGSFSELILEHHSCESLSLIEPSNEMYQQLVARIRYFETHTRLATYNATFAAAAPLLKAQTNPDSIIYVNVLEHIADDVLELKSVHQALCKGGRAFIFVPALQWLYGSFDRSVGHARRYGKGELEDKLRRSGFEIMFSRYFDVSGIVPWLIAYRLIGFLAMPRRGVKFYDRFIVPAARRIESLVAPPIGKNVIVVAERR